MVPITARTALALAPLALFSVTPAHVELVNAANPETIKAIVESQGWPATIVATEGYDPYIESNRHSTKFLVLFMNCDSGERFQTPQYYMGFSAAHDVTIDKAACRERVCLSE